MSTASAIRDAVSASGMKPFAGDLLFGGESLGHSVSLLLVFPVSLLYSLLQHLPDFGIEALFTTDRGES
jgi:hypothetical protein